MRDLENKYKVIRALSHYKLKSDSLTIKLYNKQRKNSKASNLFTTTSEGKYITGLYPMSNSQSIDLDKLENGYLGDYEGKKICFYFKENTCLILEYKPKTKKVKYE